ncbi:MAG: SUMF1/EgtB/PvdO family nonheme iron enzyme [Planctomycetota bacterium]
MFSYFRFWAIVFSCALGWACSSDGADGDEALISHGNGHASGFQKPKSVPKQVDDGATAYLELPRNQRGYRVFERRIDQVRVILVPAGHFLKRDYMFLPPERDGGTWRELPAFLCDEYEVTNTQVLKFLESQEGLITRGQTIFSRDGKSPLISSHRWGLSIDAAGPRLREGYAQHPAVGASGHLALAYARWVGGDLPRGDEYEKAASGPSGLMFPWGGVEQKPDSTLCNSFLHGPKRTLRVGSFPKGRSPYGIHDLAGNVYERAYWNADTANGERSKLATMIKGGGWTTAHWWNHRCVDRCGQPLESMEGSVGFRVVVRDPKVLQSLGAIAETLRISVDTEEALAEASHRNVPILLYKGYETCGQCDRVQGELFREPEFVRFANQNVIVLAGHDVREGNGVPKLPLDEKGRFFAHSKRDIDELRFVFEDFKRDSPVKYFPVPEEVELFIISPGLFLLNPHVELMKGPADPILIAEQAFMRHKTGGSIDVFKGLIKEAQGYLGPGMSWADYRGGKPALVTSWRPGRRRAKTGVAPVYSE